MGSKPREPAGEKEDCDRAIAVIGKSFNVTLSQIKGKRRTKDLAYARQCVAYILRTAYRWSMPEIGRALGHRDHTTVLYACRKIAGDVKTNDAFRGFLENLMVAVIKKCPLPTYESSRAIRGIETPSRLKGVFIGPTTTSDKLLNTRYDCAPSKREEEIISQYRAGKTLEEIAEVFGITRERIRQLVFSGMLKEIALKARDDIVVNVEEFWNAARVEHLKSRRVISGELREAIVSDITAQGETTFRFLGELAKKHGVSTKILVENMPWIKDFYKGHKSRWSRSYRACRGCGTTTIPHLRKGFCEDCGGNIRGERREKIIKNLGSKCEVCDISRGSAIMRFGRDLYVSRVKDGGYSTLCRKCFLSLTGSKMGAMTIARWKKLAKEAPRK